MSRAPSSLTDAQLQALPAILLLGPRQSGKSQTLASWSVQFNLYERGDGGALQPIVQRGRVEFRSPDVAEYIVEIDGVLFRLFDVPGEVLNATPVGDRHETTAAGRMLGQFLQARPRIAGVIAFAVPPCERGAVGCISDRTQLRMDKGQELGEVQVTAQLKGVFELIRGFVAQRLHDASMPPPAVCVQVGFADLVEWREGALERLGELHGALCPGSVSEMNLPAIRVREATLRELDELARSTFGWLAHVQRAVPGVDFQCVPVSNEAVRLPVLASQNTGASLLSVTSRYEGARLRREARRRAFNISATLVGCAILLVAGLWAVLARTAPEWLPGGLAVNACLRPGPPEERCGCMQVLARDETRLPFRERLERVAPFAAACRRNMMDAVPPTRPQLLSLAAQVELARAAIAPAEFSAARYEAAVQAGGRPGAFPGPLPWFPAESAGQVRALQAVQSLVDTGEVAEATRLVEGLAAAERAEFRGLLRLLGGAKDVSACLNEWKRARESGVWRTLATHCGREGERLPVELQPCYRADAALRFSESSAQTGTPCADAGGCVRGGGLEGLLYRAPKPDHVTFANLAARAATPEELAQCVARAEGAGGAHGNQGAHLLLLRLLGPGSFDDRLATARGATDEHWVGVSELLRREWVMAETGKRVGGTGRRAAAAQRAPMLPLRHVAEAACALVDLPARYDPPASPIPWREPVETEPLGGNSAAAHRARAALTLLAAADETRTIQSAGCELTAAVTLLLRLPEGPDHLALKGRLSAAFQVVENVRDVPEAATTVAAAGRLRCRLGPAYAASAEDARRYYSTCGSVADTESSPPATQASAATR